MPVWVAAVVCNNPNSELEEVSDPVTATPIQPTTGAFFAFLSPVVGWVGVAVTESDTSGGVLGKMISPQNLAIAAAVVGMEHKESAVFRKVVWWSLGLLLGMCVLVYLQSTPVLGWMVFG